MTIPSNVNFAGSNALAQLNPLARPGAPAVADRQVVADGGNVAPAAVTYEQLVDARKMELNNAVRNVAGYVQNITRELNFSVDEKLGKTVVTVVDHTTGEVIRQIPSEDMLKLSNNLAELRERSAKGLLFRGDA